MPYPVTLKQNTEFNRAYCRGKVKASPAMVTYVLKNRGLGCRIGITTSKSSAVQLRETDAAVLLGRHSTHSPQIASVTLILCLLQGSKQKTQKQRHYPRYASSFNRARGH